jgi:hypothetical protein
LGPSDRAKVGLVDVAGSLEFWTITSISVFKLAFFFTKVFFMHGLLLWLVVSDLVLNILHSQNHLSTHFLQFFLTVKNQWHQGPLKKLLTNRASLFYKRNMETKRTQKNMAMALGISEFTLSRYLNGKSRAKGIKEAQRLVGAAYAIGSKTVAEDWLFPRSETLRKALGV